MATMKRIQYYRSSGPEVMRLEDVEPVRPDVAEVPVGVRAAAANPMDWEIHNDSLKIVPKFPAWDGYDFAGAEAVGADGKGVVKKPADLLHEEAAALPTVGIIAFRALISKGNQTRASRLRHQTPLPRSSREVLRRGMIAQPITDALDEVARAARQGHTPAANRSHGAFTEALTELERNRTPKGGKLIITPGQPPRRCHARCRIEDVAEPSRCVLDNDDGLSPSSRGTIRPTADLGLDCRLRPSAAMIASVT